MAAGSYEWLSNLKALPSKIDSALSKDELIHKNQCLVLKSLFYSVAQYVELWMGPLEDYHGQAQYVELWMGLWEDYHGQLADYHNLFNPFCFLTRIDRDRVVSASSAGMELLKVLTEGMKLVHLCAADQPSPGELFMILSSFAQFREIIDDTRRYCQMINRLISQRIRTKKSFSRYYRLDVQQIELKEKLVDEIKYKVEFDCKALQTTLEWACEQDKLLLLKSLKSSKRFQSLSPDFVNNSLISKIETGFFCIDSRDLSIGDKLGGGSFGHVSKGSWCGIPVAVKESEENSPAMDVEVGIFREKMMAHSSHIVQLLGQCEEEYIVGVGNLGTTTSKKQRLVLELMDTDLEKFLRIQQKRIFSEARPLLDLVDIILQIAKGMKHLHDNKVIYRDMKPANILIKQRDDESLLIKLADFGISKSNFQTGLHTNMAGTLRYMAPEMLIKGPLQMLQEPPEWKNMYSSSVDVYSFAIVCSQILTGECWDLVMKSSDILKEVKQIQGELKSKLLVQKGIPGMLKDLLVSCWEEEGRKRPTFEYICEQLWIIKEELLIWKYDSCQVQISMHETSELKSQMDSLDGFSKRVAPGMPRISAPYYSIVHVLPHDYRDYLEDKGFSTQGLGLDLVPFVLNLNDDEIAFTARRLNMFERLLVQEGKRFNLTLGIKITATIRLEFNIDRLMDILNRHPIFNGVYLETFCHKIEDVIPALEQLRKALPGFVIAFALGNHSLEVVQKKVSHSLFDQIWVPFNSYKSAKGLEGAIPSSKIFIDKTYRNEEDAMEATKIANLVKLNNLGGTIATHNRELQVHTAYNIHHKLMRMLQ